MFLQIWRNKSAIANGCTRNRLRLMNMRSVLLRFLKSMSQKKPRQQNWRGVMTLIVLDYYAFICFSTASSRLAMSGSLRNTTYERSQLWYS